MENSVHEADAGALVWVLIGKFDVDLPEPASEWSYTHLVWIWMGSRKLASTDSPKAL